MNRHIADPLAALKTNVALPFERARAMPPEVYTTQEFHDAVLEHIFGREWFCVGRASSLLNRGNTSPAMILNVGFCKGDYPLPTVRCEEWLGWVFVTLNPDCPPLAEKLAEVEAIIAGYDMSNYQETFFETHLWDTNWKILAENFMESYHLPVCHAGTIGGFSKLEEMVCPLDRVRCASGLAVECPRNWSARIMILRSI